MFWRKPMTASGAALGYAGKIRLLLSEAWPILGELGRLYAELVEETRVWQVFWKAAETYRHLAETSYDEADGYSCTTLPAYSMPNQSQPSNFSKCLLKQIIYINSLGPIEHILKVERIFLNF